MALRNSTLLRKLNAGDDVEASEEFKKWNHVHGEVVAGLTKRRAKEAELFLA
jgi:lysozyme